MTERPFLSPAMAARIKALDQRGFDTDELFMDDTYVIRRLRRDSGWSDGSDVEAWDEVESGVGRLSETGMGGNQMGEDVIASLTPYRFRLPVTTVLTSNDELIVNGRTFLVTDVSRGDVDARFATAYLQERLP